MSRDPARKVIVTAAWLLFALCCVCPVVWMLFGSARSGSIAAAASALTEGRQRALLGNTLALGVSTAGLTAGVGIPLGIVLARCDVSRVLLPRFLLVLPLVLPSYVLALAWIVLFGARAASWVYSLPAAGVVLGFSLYPVVMLATEASLRSVSSRLEEAGRLVASSHRVWLKITLPLIAPSLSASLLIVFVLGISDFAVPGLLRVRVYTTEVFTAFAALYDFRLATLMALPLAVVATLASVVALEFVRRPLVARVDRAPSGLTWSDKTQRPAVAAISAVAVVLMAVPIGAVLLEARTGRSALGDAVSIEAIRNSFLWSAASASLVLLSGTVLGYWRTKAALRLAHAADGLWVTLFAIPATIVGVGIIGLWNRPGFAGDIYRSDAIVLLGYLGRFLPVGALLCAAFLQRIPTGAEEAATVSGASWMRTFTRIVLPMAARSLAAVWLMIFILVFGDVALAILLAPPGESSLPVRAYTLIANSTTGDVARLALVQIAVSVLPLAAIVVLLRRKKGSIT